MTVKITPQKLIIVATYGEEKIKIFTKTFNINKNTIIINKILLTNIKQSAILIA